jgi:hypothetical protein
MVHCNYCGESDESRLIISSRFVNGEVKHNVFCSKCFWREKFETEGGDGKLLSEDEKCRRTNSEREIFKRFKLSSPSLG